MKTVTVFSNKKDCKQAANDLVEQACTWLDFEPDRALFYSTLRYNGKYQSMLGIFHEEHGEMICIASPETSCITKSIEGCFT